MVIVFLFQIYHHTHQLSCSRTGCAYNFVVVGSEVCFHLLQSFVSPAHLHNRAKKLDPVARQIERVFPFLYVMIVIFLTDCLLQKSVVVK